MVNCKQCQAGFEVLNEDRKYYDSISPAISGKKFQIPAPDICPECRHQNRSAFRNERVLYKRACDLCKKNIVTVFHEDQPFPVYCPECWWGDKWDGRDFGRDFDFNRPFFEQFRELQDVVPRLSLNNAQSENSEYCNQCIRNKDSYLLFGSDDNRDSMYSYWIQRCNDTYNCNWMADCELCLDSLDCEGSYGCIGSQDLKNCTDCYFSFDLIGCKNCFGCAGLRNKEYYIFNEPYSKEEYEEKLKSFNMGSWEGYQALAKKAAEVHAKGPRKYVHIFNSENCTGDYISNSKNCLESYDLFESEDCRYSYNLCHKHYNNVDVSYATELRNAYQVMSTYGEEIYFSTFPWGSSNVWYCDLTHNCKDLFGCVGLQSQKNCIFNKEYTTEEYENLKGRIIEHMVGTGEWGRFFPVEYSNFAYNETAAQDFFPITKDEVLKRGWKWREVDERDYKPQTYVVQDDIKDVKEDICNTLLACSECKRNYKILPQELEIYRRKSVPVPRICSDCRFRKLLARRNPRKLWDRKCDKCAADIKTTYSPERPEKVYCEKCYLDSVY